MPQELKLDEPIATVTHGQIMGGGPSVSDTGMSLKEIKSTVSGYYKDAQKNQDDLAVKSVKVAGLAMLTAATLVALTSSAVLATIAIVLTGVSGCAIASAIEAKKTSKFHGNKADAIESLPSSSIRKEAKKFGLS